MWLRVKSLPLTEDCFIGTFFFIIIIIESYLVNREKRITWRERIEWLGPYFLEIQKAEDTWSPCSSYSALTLVWSSPSSLPSCRRNSPSTQMTSSSSRLSLGPVLPGCLLWHPIHRRLGLPVIWSIISHASYCRVFFVYSSLLNYSFSRL